MAISRITVSNFRGIVNPLEIDFLSGTNSRPASLIISGDNGTGKSSIVDAVEFALQGKVGKQKLPLHSFSVEKDARVDVLFSDGTSITREINIAGNRRIINNLNPHNKYAVASFVLRRSDILKFIEAPESQRQIIFLQYFKGSIKHVQGTSDLQQAEIDSLEQRLEEKLKVKRSAILEIAEYVGIPLDSIPIDTQAFEKFVTREVYKGISHQERQKAMRQGRKLLPRPIHKALKLYRETTQEISYIKKEIKKIGNSLQYTDTSELQTILANVGEILTDAFRSTTRQDFIDHIKVVFGSMTAVSLSIEIHLKNGAVCTPHQIFSEANLDLLALLVFIALLKESAKRGQAKLLILDDVFQSVDAGIRISVIDYLMKEFSDWQFIFTVHDRLWRNQLRETLRRHGHAFVEREIIRWSFNEGPVIREAKRDMESPLVEAMKNGESVSICAHAGILLETICDRLSWALPVSVIRRKEDKYTLGDLWPGIAKGLRRTNAKNESDEIDKWLHLRNMIGAHYNEWALSLSSQEAFQFGDAVMALYNKTHCSICFSWIEDRSTNSRGAWECRCGKTALTST